MKKFLSLVLALIMAMSLVTISAGAMDFTDADDVDFDEAVEVISALGIVSGNNGAFMPKDFLTRQAAAKIVAGIALGTDKAAKLPTGTAPFSDVPAGNQFAGYIAYLKDLGIVGGYGDGSFGPRGFLTGDAFLKQVLGVLGYKADIEGYSGNGWQVSVAIDAANAGLLEGLEDINTAANITREQAAQVMLNALQADVVGYGERYTLDVGGLVLSYGEVGSKSAGSVDYTENDDKDAADNATMQLCEQVFPKLTKDASITDNFGRPAVKWTLEKKEICTAAKTPDLTYTTTPSLANLYADLEMTEAGTWTAYVDGVKKGTGTLEGGLANLKKYVMGKAAGDLSANGAAQNTVGATHEVYYDADTKTATIIVINEYLAEVKAVKEPIDATTKRTVDVKQYGDVGVNPDTGATTFSITGYETEEFAKGDIVVFTYSNKQKDSKDLGIQSMAIAETKSGKVTRVGGSSLVYLDGESVRRATASSLAFNGDTAQYDEAAIAYLNSNGFFLLVEAEAADNYAVLLDAKKDTSVLFGEAKNMVQLLLTDGTVEIVEADSDKYYESALVGEFVKYTANNKGQYTLTDVDAVDFTSVDGNGKENKGNNLVASEISVKNGAANMVFNGPSATHIINGKTTFLVKELDTEGKVVYNVYAGNKAVPTIKCKTGDENKGIVADRIVNAANAKVMDYVYIDATAMDVDTTSNNNAMMFMYRPTDAGKFTNSDGSWYNVYAIIDNSVKSIQYDYDARAAEKDASAYTLYKTYTINEKGFYVGGEKLNPTTKNAMVGVKYADGVLQCNTSANSGTGSATHTYVLADDCEIAMIDYNKDLARLNSADEIAEDANDNVYVWTDKDTGEAIFVLIVQMP